MKKKKDNSKHISPFVLNKSTSNELKSNHIVLRIFPDTQTQGIESYITKNVSDCLEKLYNAEAVTTKTYSIGGRLIQENIFEN
jgi:hypothetical protein